MKFKYYIIFLFALTSISFVAQEQSDDETSAISTKDVEFKVLDSKYLDVNELWKPFEKYWITFTEEDYKKLKPLILETDIPALQKLVYKGKLSYRELTLFYLYRIKKFDRENRLSLNAIISLNPNVVNEASTRDEQLHNRMFKPPIFGLPILLKDNINVFGLPTTAGAIAMVNNQPTEDAYITKRLLNQGAIVLGKTNLSEWAYFFCGECPSGYSAVGGQTLNPYGRKIIDTGGSSSGSGVASASNFAVATVGTETAGSILSPASANSSVGLKPTVGLLSRTGIVPISGTLDTPGPITKNVVDNAIMLDAMIGYDESDSAKFEYEISETFYQSVQRSESETLKDKKFGAFKELMKDSLYVAALEVLKEDGAEIIVIDEVKMKLTGFMTLLNLDMRKDLPVYLKMDASDDISIHSVQDVIAFNKKDSVLTMPYGQNLFYGIVNDTTSRKELLQIKDSLQIKGKHFFDVHFEVHNLDAILSINNYHAGEAAVAKYPALTVPMGYEVNGTPMGLTFIGKPISENNLYIFGAIYERNSKARKPPINYE